MTPEDKLELAADKAEAASDIAYEWANGPEYESVNTDSGPLPTLAEFLRQKGSVINHNTGLDRVVSVPDLPALRALTGMQDGSVCSVVSDGREWVWEPGDRTAEISADSGSVLYVAADSDPSGAAGAWRYYPDYRPEGANPGFSRNALAIGVAESSSIGTFWGYDRMDGTGFLSSDTGTNRAWLASATTFEWLEVETPFGVIIGDSIAEGHPALHGRLHPNANTFEPNWPNSPGQPSYELSALTNMYWYNHGIGGQTTSQVWARWRRDVLAETYDPGDGRGDKTLHRQPYCVWVNCGINDISFGVPASVTKINLVAMAMSAKQAGILIGFNTCGPHKTHTPDQIAQQIELRDWMMSELPRYGAWVFDFRTWFADPNDPDKPNPILIADNVHPTRAGYISYAAALVQQTGAPIVMGQLSVESKVDPAGVPSALATPKEIRVEHVGTGEDSVQRFRNSEARPACNFDMTNTRTLRLYISESTHWPPSSAERAAISKVRGVFGTEKSSASDGRSAYCVIRHDNTNGFFVSDFYDMQDVIDASIVGTSHVRIRFTRPVRNVQASPYGSASPYDFGISLSGGNPRERILYVFDRATGASIDPNTATGTFFVNITAE